VLQYSFRDRRLLRLYSCLQALHLHDFPDDWDGSFQNSERAFSVLHWVHVLTMHTAGRQNREGRSSPGTFLSLQGSFAAVRILRDIKRARIGLPVSSNGHPDIPLTLHSLLSSCLSHRNQNPSQSTSQIGLREFRLQDRNAKARKNESLQHSGRVQRLG
jgi:hypothetical protein